MEGGISRRWEVQSKANGLQTRIKLREVSGRWLKRAEGKVAEKNNFSNELLEQRRINRANKLQTRLRGFSGR